MEQRKEQKSRFRIERLEERIAPAIVAVNGGGNTPNGNANGVPARTPPAMSRPGSSPDPAPKARVTLWPGPGAGRPVPGLSPPPPGGVRVPRPLFAGR